MAKWHLRSNRKASGKRLIRLRKKRRLDRGSRFLETKIGKRKIKITRRRGGNQKIRLMSAEIVNLADPKSGKIAKSKILDVNENLANPHYVRRGIITKGAIIKTEAGSARVTSRPGQSGVINAVLVKAEKK